MWVGKNKMRNGQTDKRLFVFASILEGTNSMLGEPYWYQSMFSVEVIAT